MKKENIGINTDLLTPGLDSFNDLPNYFNKGEDILAVGKKDRSNFCQGDSVDLYRKNLKKQPNDWYYRTNRITYDTNSYGYRTKDFDQISWKDSIVIFGCSNVFGIGVDESNTLSANLSRYSNREVINMGVPASSNELMLYNSLMLKRKYGIPWCVIFVWTSVQRSTHFYELDVTHIGHWNYKDSEKILESKLFEAYNIPWQNAPIKSYYNVMIAKDIWEKETNFYSTSQFMSTSEYCKIDYLPYFIPDARDLSHPGIESMKMNAEILYNKIINKNG